MNASLALIRKNYIIDRSYLHLLSVISLFLGILPLIYENSGILVSVALGAAIILVQLFRFLTVGMDFSRLEEWAIFGFFIWMPVGFYKYYFDIDVSRTLDPSVVDYCASLMCFGFSANLAGMLFPFKVKIPRTLENHVPLRFHLPLIIILTLIFFGVRIQYNNFIGTITPARSLLYSLAVMFIPLTTVLAYRCYRRSRGLDKFLFLIFVLMLCFSALGDTSRRVFGFTMFGIIFVALPADQFKLRFNNIRNIFLLLLILSSFYLIATAMRSVSFSEGDAGTFKHDLYTAGKSARNLSTLSDYALCIELYPDKVPYLYGSSYVNAFFTFLPRPIWPDKPVAFSKELAIRKLFTLAPYEYSPRIEPLINYESYSGTFIGEAWANFGILGVLFISFIYGVLIASASRWSGFNDDNSWLKSIYGLIVFIVLIQHRGCFSAINALLILNLLYIYILNYVFFSKKNINNSTIIRI